MRKSITLLDVAPRSMNNGPLNVLSFRGCRVLGVPPRPVVVVC
jgi:hypothetical protein